MNFKLKLLSELKGQIVLRPLTYAYLMSCRKLTCYPPRQMLTAFSVLKQNNIAQSEICLTQGENFITRREKCSVQNTHLLYRRGKFTTQQKVYPAKVVPQIRYYSSAIFVSDRHSDSTSGFQFDNDLEERLSDTEQLKINLQRRGLDIDIEQLKKDYFLYVELEKERMNIEAEREDIARQIASIVSQQKETKSKTKEQIFQMKKLAEEGKKARTHLKELMGKFWEIEEKVMLTALSLPNHLSQDVPEVVKVCQEFFQDRKPATPIDHDEVLSRSKMVRLSNVGHKAYYLTGRLSVLEQELVNYFSVQLRSQEVTQMLAPEMFKTPVVEAGCIDATDPTSVYRLQHKQGTRQITDWNADHMFLQGASQLSFLSYFAKMLISSEDLPVKMFVVGRNYIPENAERKYMPGLFGVLQSIKVCLCGVCNNRESSSQIMERFTELLTDIYKQFELPFRLVSVPASSLSVAEQNRTELQIWVPSLQQNLKLGSVSVCGDYSSRRLMIRCSDSSRKSPSSPVYMVHCEVTDITRMIAVLLEYSLTDKNWVFK